MRCSKSNLCRGTSVAFLLTLWGCETAPPQPLFEQVDLRRRQNTMDCQLSTSQCHTVLQGIGSLLNHGSAICRDYGQAAWDLYFHPDDGFRAGDRGSGQAYTKWLVQEDRIVLEEENIYLNPSFFDSSRSDAQRGAIIAHEMEHLMGNLNDDPFSPTSAYAVDQQCGG